MTGPDIATVAVSISLGLTIASLWLYFTRRYSALDLRAGEHIIRQAFTVMMPGPATYGRTGQLVLTNQRLLWVPSVLQRVLPGTSEVALDLQDISECAVGSVNWTNRIIQKPLIVRGDGRLFLFYLSGNPLAQMTAAGKLHEWCSAIVSESRISSTT